MECSGRLAHAINSASRSFVRSSDWQRWTTAVRLGGMTAGTATCAYPDCDSPVAPPPPTGGRSSYCVRPDHNRTTAFAVRRAEAAGRASATPETAAGTPSGPPPAEALTEVADRLRQTLSAIHEQVRRAQEALTQAADAELLEVERAAVRTD